LSPFKPSSPETVHVCFIFDENRSEFAWSAIQSIVFYSTAPVVFHILSPLDMHSSIMKQSSALGLNTTMLTYDITLCRRLVAQVWFIAKHIHLSAMCKLFLADIIDAQKVIYLDTDITVVQDISKCWQASLHSLNRRYIAMAVDMGDVCQLDPDKCFPIGFERKIGNGLVCGTMANRSSSILRRGLPCRSPGEYETYQFNGGVILMDLKAMRSERFTTKLVQSSIQTWRRTNFRQAQWGEQDMINNFFRLYPHTMQDLSCGCNYQFSGARRFTQCSNESIVIAHGWSAEMMNKRSKNPYKLHFDFFKTFDSQHADGSPPYVAQISPMSDVPTGPRETAKHDAECSHQSHVCTASDREESEGMSVLFLTQVVNVLTRTSGRPRFFADMLKSVEELHHPSVRHLVLTDDIDSVSYINASRVHKSILVPSQRDAFDANLVCTACANLSAKCAVAPYMDHPIERQKYFDCYCNTPYPMNEYMNSLYSMITEGWVVFLDDDNLFQDPFSLTELLAHVQSEDEVVVFRSQLGRLTPADVNFGKRIERGDFDSSNMMFHSKHLSNAKWPGLRCADFRVGKTLSSILPVRWVNLTVMKSNPLRSSIGGLGARNDIPEAGIVVIITSHQHMGWRPRWVREIVEYYLSQDLTGLISRVIFVWNNQDHPFSLPMPSDRRFIFLQSPSNSLNSRWMLTLDHITAETIALNLDDDIYVTQEGLRCLLNWHRNDPSRLIAPFVRRVDRQSYVLDELEDSSTYSIVLPRILILPVSYMRMYASPAMQQRRDYVDLQSAHCDDILLNILAQSMASKGPLRVVLPKSSIIDFYAYCWKQNKTLTGGLSLEVDRSKKRSECVQGLMRLSNISNFLNSSDIGTCLADGGSGTVAHFVPKKEYNEMFRNVTTCGSQ
jgi:lipopolysaccharide biosynthesis glycosyltransferase